MAAVGVKVRRIDHYPDDWIAGAIALTLEERGMHDTACNLIYSHGGPIDPDHLRRACPCHGRVFDRLLERLLYLGKLFMADDGKIDQKRCQTELKNARKRIETSRENGQKGGRWPSKNNTIAEPAGSSRAREGVASITIFKKKKGKADDQLGRAAPSAEEIAAVDHTVEQVAVALKGWGSRIRDPVAYNATVHERVWEAWLNNVGRYAMRTMKGQALVDACEVVEEARRAGSREATPAHIQKVLNDLDRLDRLDRGCQKARNGV
jgi:uncharacterized protein YdaU (DUF1376 family)